MKLLKIFSKLVSRRDQLQEPKRPFRMSGGTSVTPDTSMQVAAFNRGVIFISTQIAKLPWHIKDKKNEIIEDRLSNLLDLAPNPEMNSFMFRLTMLQNALIWGNGYAEIERDNIGRVVALWPLPSQNVQVIRVGGKDETRLVYRILGMSSTSQGDDTYLLPKDVFHIKNFHTLDGLVGQSIAAYASETLGISLGGDRMANSLFANGGMPSGTLEAPSSLSDEAFARIKESWAENHGGRKAGGIAILEEGMKYNPVSFSPDVLQFLESRKFSVIEIARFLGLPPTKLYDTDAATFDNVENANLEVVTDTLDAWATNFEMEADVKILNNRFGGRFTEFDLYAVFRGDMDTRSQYFSRMMQSAAMTPNEIRKKEGMPSVADLDRFFLAVNNFTPMDRVDEVIDSQVAPKNSEPTDIKKDKKEDKDETDKEMKNAVISFLNSRNQTR